MRLTFHIALRFLLAKKRPMLMSLAGIVFGVAFFIVTQAQTSGFQHFFIDKILGINGAIRIQDQFQQIDTSVQVTREGDAFDIALSEGRKISNGIPHPDMIREAALSFSQVAEAAPVLRGNIRVFSGFRDMEGRVFGIDLQEFLRVSSLAQQVIAGDLQDFQETRDGAVIGSILAERLELRLGDPVFLQGSGERLRFRITAIVESGVELYDKTSVYVHLRSARQLLGQAYGVSYLQVSVHDPDAALDLAPHMQHALGHYVASWQEREKSWLEAFVMLSWSSILSLSVILLIAGLGMFNTLAIIVMERKRDIAILRSIGYTRGDINRVFLLQGLVILVSGLLLGWFFAALINLGLERLPIQLNMVFSTDSLMVDWSIWHYVQSAVLATIMVLLATMIPARRAARVQPANIIRGMD